MTFGARQLSCGFVFASILAGGVMAACGSPSDDGAPATSSQAILCESGGIHVEGCAPSPDPIPRPIVPRHVVCPVNPTCASAPKDDFADAGFDPAWSPSAEVTDGLLGYWGKDTSFAAGLVTAGCTPERYFFVEHPNDDGGAPIPGSTSDRKWWATTICPISYEPPEGDTAGIISCSSCTDTPPSTAYHVVAWATNEPFRLPGHPPILGKGCNEDSCDGICNNLDCLEPPAQE
jgi:hypothetical protein